MRIQIDIIIGENRLCGTDRATDLQQLTDDGWNRREENIYFFLVVKKLHRIGKILPSYFRGVKRQSKQNYRIWWRLISETHGNLWWSMSVIFDDLILFKFLSNFFLGILFLHLKIFHLTSNRVLTLSWFSLYSPFSKSGHFNKKRNEVDYSIEISPDPLWRKFLSP